MELFENPLHQFLQTNLYDGHKLKAHHQEGLTKLLSSSYAQNEFLRHELDLSNGYIMIITRDTKRELFGSPEKFDEINNQLGGVFELKIEHNRHKRHAKGYGISQKAVLLLEQFEIAWLADGFLIQQGGKIRKAKTPIQSRFLRTIKLADKTKREVMVNAKETHKPAKLPNTIPIEMDCLLELAKAAHQFLPKYPDRFSTCKNHLASRSHAVNKLLERKRLSESCSNIHPAVRNVYQSWLEQAETVDEMVAMFRHVHRVMVTALALRCVAKHYGGFVPIQYTESSQGRLYATKYYPNLQTISSDVRKVAMAGCFDIDLDNCHYSILWNEAKKAGVDLKHIEHYNNNKSYVRNKISQDLGIPIENVKAAMISLMYGAKLEFNNRLNRDTVKVGAIGVILGTEERVNQFKQHPLVKGIVDDLKLGGQAVVKYYIQNHQDKNGFITNRYGVSLSIKDALFKNGNVKRKPQRTLLSFILQGAERTVLDTMIQSLDGSKIMLLQHDGLTYSEYLTRQELDAIEQKILSQTGLVLSIGNCEPLSHRNALETQDIAA